MLQMFTYANQDVLAGLTWAVKRQAGLLRRAPLALNWADRIALVPEEPEYPGKVSLLSCLTAQLGEEAHKGRVLVAWANDLAADDLAADDTQDLFFAAVLLNGKPAIGAERLFDTRAELLTHIDVECSSGQIDRLATTAEIAGALHNPIPVSLFPAPATDHTFEPVSVEGRLARQLSLGGIDWQTAAVGGAGVLCLAAAAILLFPFQQSKPSVAAPAIAPVQTTYRNEPAFGRNCLAAFAGDWPISPGWQVISEGCATPEMRDPALTGFAPAHPVAYRVWQLRGGFDGAIARKAAEAVYAGSALTMVIQGNRLFSSKEIVVPVLDPASAPDSSAALTPAELLAASEAVFLGLADSIVLQGGSASGQSGIPKVRVTLNSGFAEVFERVQRIEGAEIARLNRTGKTVTLEITGRRAVPVPVEIAGEKTAWRNAPEPVIAPSAPSPEPDRRPDMQKDEVI